MLSNGEINGILVHTTSLLASNYSFIPSSLGPKGPWYYEGFGSILRPRALW